ncbi:hypothetical protein FH972_020480 [Carpinus fangiana]|uniref:Uncharacterized protein n=1 Tax=Carpinus fangiana TaxID=176857 RepID=A0A5N6RTL1_9ROSI|nr:hypothetical protein FH972_020480 [Carpinus fangiana]
MGLHRNGFHGGAGLNRNGFHGGAGLHWVREKKKHRKRFRGGAEWVSWSALRCVRALRRMSGLQQLPRLWTSPPSGFLKASFDVTMHKGMAVAAATLSDSNSNIIVAVSRKHTSLDANIGESFCCCLSYQYGQLLRLQLLIT